jgi:predicted flap endonuclease-1-like 5' DNA nuclease
MVINDRQAIQGALCLTSHARMGSSFLWDYRRLRIPETNKEQIGSIDDSYEVGGGDPMPSNVVRLSPPSSAPGDSAEAGARKLDGRQAQGGSRSMSLHVSKLRGISNQLRNKLKQQGVTYTHQLLDVAGSREGRRALAARSGIEEPVLLRLTCRADLARIKGVGAIFADMLELIGVDRLSTLAGQDPGQLHGILHELNAAERFARRAPTQEEVADWVGQAQTLPHMVGPDS